MAEDIAKRRRRSPQFDHALCPECGIEFRPTGNQQKRCAPCALARRSLAEKARHQKTIVARGRRLGVEMKCGRCSAVILRIGSRQRYCKPCSKEVTRESDRIAQRAKRKRPDQRLKAKARSLLINKTDAHKAYIRRYERARRARDPKFALHARMKAMIGNALREKKGRRSWQCLVGYSCADLMDHLERQFTKGMSWENRNNWQIDHIRPVSAFSFSSSEDADFKDCWALTNLRPLWKRENRAKWNKRVFLI